MYSPKAINQKYYAIDDTKYFRFYYKKIMKDK